MNALQRAQDFYQLDRMDIGAIKVMGNLAVVDTVLYGRVVTSDSGRRENRRAAVSAA